MKSYYYCHFLRSYHHLKQKKSRKYPRLDYQKNPKQYSNRKVYTVQLQNIPVTAQAVYIVPNHLSMTLVACHNP